MSRKEKDRAAERPEDMPREVQEAETFCRRVPRRRLPPKMSAALRRPRISTLL